jgi:hypothetical protein
MLVSWATADDWPLGYKKGAHVNDTWVRYALAVVLAHAAVNLPHAAAMCAAAIWLPTACLSVIRYQSSVLTTDT